MPIERIFSIHFKIGIFRGKILIYNFLYKKNSHYIFIYFINTLSN